MKQKPSVEAFSDRTFTIIKIKDDKIMCDEYYTSTLQEIKRTLDALKDMDENDVCLACCYKQYEGSFNVIVNPKEQYSQICNYACHHYKTFSKNYTI